MTCICKTDLSITFICNCFNLNYHIHCMTSTFSQLILFCLYFSVPFFDIKWNVQAKKLETAYTACDINS